MLLVIEDNPYFSRVINEALSRRGFHFDIVDSGLEAIQRVLHHGDQYSLALVDLGLPDIPGAEVIAKIRSIGSEARAGIPIVIMTGAEPVPPEVIAEYAIGAVLYKPFLVRDLLKTIESCSRPLGDEGSVLQDRTEPAAC